MCGNLLTSRIGAGAWDQEDFAEIRHRNGTHRPRLLDGLYDARLAV